MYEISKVLDSNDIPQHIEPVYPSFDPSLLTGLQEVVEAWDGLPDEIKAGILAMVAASKPVEPPPLGGVLSNRLNTWPRRPGGNPKRRQGALGPYEFRNPPLVVYAFSVFTYTPYERTN